MSEAWFITYRKARKPHQCGMCGRRIDPGEVYKHGVGVDGSAWTWKECRHCTYVLEAYDLAWDGEYSVEAFDEWVNNCDYHDLMELRLMAGYRKQWRTREGILWALPVGGTA